MRISMTPVHDTSQVLAGGSLYAAGKDFCAIFDEDMDSLYSLSLLLTGDHTRAQQCFLSALDECLSGTPVFKGWARSWSRRAIIKQAIRLMTPAYGESQAAPDALAGEMAPSARPLLLLGQFDRFVFVMSVLEKYTVRECAALLKCDSRRVEQARTRALQSIAHGPELAPAAYANGLRTEQLSSLMVE